jgi:hypothetical protein
LEIWTYFWSATFKFDRPSLKQEHELTNEMG